MVVLSCWCGGHSSNIIVYSYVPFSTAEIFRVLVVEVTGGTAVENQNTAPESHSLLCSPTRKSLQLKSALEGLFFLRVYGSFVQYSSTVHKKRSWTSTIYTVVQ